MAKTYQVTVSSSKGNDSCFVNCDVDEQARLVATLVVLATWRVDILSGFNLEFDVKTATYDDVIFAQAIRGRRKVIYSMDDFDVSLKITEAPPA